MKAKKLVWLAISAIFVGAMLLCSQIAASQDVQVEKGATMPRPKYRPGEVLVRFRPGVPGQAKAAAHAAVRARVVREYHIVPGLQLVRLPKGKSVEKAVAMYEKNPNVLHAHPNYLKQAANVPNDPLFASQWGLNNTGQNGGVFDADIDAPEAWNLATGSRNVVVAVIDSGINYNHEDLAPNMWQNPNDCNGDGQDSDNNGYVDDCHGIDTVNGDSDPMDDQYHGTHVAGIIGAAGHNGTGVAGVNWNVSIMACKALDSQGSGADSDLIECLGYISSMKDRGVNVVAINASFGGPFFDEDELAAIEDIQKKGILFVAAAGNNGALDNDLVPVYPANYDLANIVSVAATNRDDTLRNTSHFGTRTVDLGAPGGDILSTWLSSFELTDCEPPYLYCSISGTSMAAPFVTGVAALLKAYNPTLDWKAIRNLILAGGDDNAALAGKTLTGKRLNANGALTCSTARLSVRLQPATDQVPAVVGEPVDLRALNIVCAQPDGEVQVTVSPTGSVIMLHDDGAGNDQEAGDGIYSGQFVPPALGTYTLTFPGNDHVDVQSLRKYQSTLVSSEYRATDSSLNLNLDDDEVRCISSVPFPIHFGGGNFSTFCVGSNGVITFPSASNDYVNGPIPYKNPKVAIVAPFWDDLLPMKDYNSSNYNVFVTVSGNSPNREAIVEWRYVRRWECAGTVKFQVVFFENSDDILFNYADVNFAAGCGANGGGSATVGIQLSPTTGTLFSYNNAFLFSNMSILWTTGTLAVSPSSLDFGGVVVGTTSDPKTVTVTNESGSAITISDVSTTGDFAYTNNCPGSLNPDASCKIDVTFTPTVPETRTGQLTIKTGSGTTHSVDLSGNGLEPPTVELTPASLDFGQQVVQTPSDPKPVTLKNTGGVMLTIQGISAAPSDFTQSNDCGSSLEPDTTCTINVTFKPTTTDTRTGELTVKTDADPGTDVVKLTGEGTQSAIDLSPSSLDFGNQRVDIGSTAKRITLTNKGSATLNISSITTKEPFTQTNTCGSSVAAGASCTIDVTFKPATAGQAAGDLTISDDAPTKEQKVPLTGTGVEPVLTPSVTSLDFGNQTVNTSSSPKPITLQNTGSDTLAIQEISIPTGDFTQTNNCGSSLEPDKICTISIVFKPTSSGKQSKTLTVKTDAKSSPDEVKLAGEGVPPPAVDLSPSSLDFGNQRVDTESAPKRVTLTNNGPTTLNISSITTEEPFAQSNTCGSSVAAGASCTIDVTFKPTTAGPAEEDHKLTITDDAPDSPQTVGLTGTGTAPVVSLSPTSLDFGTQTVNTSSSSKLVTLKNTGSATLLIQGITIASGDFSQTNSCGSSLDPGSGCTINVTFKPNSSGKQSSTLTAKTDAESSPDEVTLTGEGVQGPAVTLTAEGNLVTSLDFGGQKINTASSPKRVTLTNSGSSTLTITGIEASGSFTQTNDCGDSVAAGANCAIDVTFRPTSTGPANEHLAITDDALDSPQSVTLTGKGTVGAVSISPTSLTFSSQLKGTTSQKQTVTVKNISDAALTVTGVEMSGDATHFNMSENCKNQSLNPQGTCAIDVQFKPGQTGSMSATLTVSTDTPNSTHTVALNGTGTDFVLGMASGSSDSATINAGQTAQFSLALQPDGFSGAVSLSCSHNATKANCAVSPTSLTLDGSTAVQVNASLSTTAGSIALPPAETTPPSGNVPLPAPWVVGILVLATLVAVLLTTRKRRQLAFAVLVAAFLASAACGGGGGATPTPPPTGSGTEPGTYTLKVTATHNTGSEVVTRTVDLKVSVTE